MWECEDNERREGKRSGSHEVKIQYLRPQGSRWAGRGAGRLRKKERQKHIKRRRWPLTFLPSRNLRAVPMLATQWILFSFLPCSHGWKEKGEQWIWKGSKRDIERERKREGKMYQYMYKKLAQFKQTIKHRWKKYSINVFEIMRLRIPIKDYKQTDQ